MRLYPSSLTAGQGFALLLLRLVVGTAFILHGWPKIQKPTSWMGDAVPGIFQLAAALAEFGGGIALIVGFLTPVVTLALAINMSVALMMVHFPKNEPFVRSGPGGDFELPLVYLALMVALFAIGPGRYSLDARLWGRSAHPVLVSRAPMRRSSAA
ncbi:MAG TPA: DoxX family protein [Thermoanaerobaculia bacterium]|nr:DoxX family protein [Thermoanaerobaculia bacterium]